MCFGSSPKPTPAPPPPADLAPAAPRIGAAGNVDNKKSQTKAAKKGTSSLRIARNVGGTYNAGTNIPKKGQDTMTSIHQRYEKLETERTPFLTRARECSKLTLPTLVPDSGHSSSSTFDTPFQGIGARGVNNLASKLLLALVPPNSPFFRLTVDDFKLQELTQQEGARAEVEEALSSIERAVMSEIESSSVRIATFEALKHLLVAGNVLLYLPEKGGMRVFHMDRYVIKRDPMGNALEMITKEDISPETLTPELQMLCDMDPDKDDGYGHESVQLYTRVIRDGKNWKVSQELKGKEVPNSEGTYPLEKTPWIPLRLSRIDGESWGRGYVEEYLGDLKSLETLTQAIVEGSAASAKVLFLVRPNGTTRARVLAEAPNGAIREGDAADVSTLQVQKQGDFQIAFQTAQEIKERLAYAFLMNSSVQRNAERVTAEEIRYMAGELEDALGGIYSILSQEFQLPLVNRLLLQMQKQRKVPALPKGIVQPTITTGLEALGRGHDLNKLAAMLEQLSQLGPETLMKHMNIGDYISRVGTSLGIDMKGLIKTEEEMNQEMQQAQMQQTGQQLAPQAFDAVKEQMMAQQQPQGNEEQ